MRVREIMHNAPFVLGWETPLREALKLMLEHQVQKAVVRNNAASMGLVDRDCLLRILVEALDARVTMEGAAIPSLATVDGNVRISALKDKGPVIVTGTSGDPIGYLDEESFLRMEFGDEGRTNADPGYSRLLCQLQEARQLSWQLDQIIEASYDGIYITDGNAVTLRVNRAYESITGLKRSLLIGKNMEYLERQKYISKSATLEVLKSGKTVTLQQNFSNGKVVLVTSNPIYNERKEIVLVVTNVRDISYLTELKEEVEQKRKLTNRYKSALNQIQQQFLDEGHLVHEDEATEKLLETARRVAVVDTSILILGETGVGKEEVAKYIHNHSRRADRQFIRVNCGSLPESLIESELFGYEKGAFTGALVDGKPGLFEVADGGTLFLDEVGELPLNMQVKLLRVLQEGEIQRIGGVSPMRVDVRILAATNRPLEQMVKEGRFREDLYYRLNIIPVYLPPLRERKKDIFPLVTRFMEGLNQKYGTDRKISKEALEHLYQYPWPGNVRELKNAVERMFVICTGDRIGLEDIPNRIRVRQAAPAEDQLMDIRDAVNQVEQRLIEKAFSRYGNVRDAARALGIDASTFVRKRSKFERLGMLQNRNNEAETQRWENEDGKG